MPNAFTRFVQRHAQMDYGIMHTALLFGNSYFLPPPRAFSLPITNTRSGDKIVDWGNTSVVTPREISVWHPKLTIDLCNLDLEREQDKLWRVSYLMNAEFMWKLNTFISIHGIDV